MNSRTLSELEQINKGIYAHLFVKDYAVMLHQACKRLFVVLISRELILDLHRRHKRKRNAVVIEKDI